MVTLIDDDEFAVADVPGPFATGDTSERPLADNYQLTMDGSAPVPVPDLSPDPIAFVFPSRNDGPAHVVNVFDMGDGDREVLCRCEATRNLRQRPKGCWAMSKARRMLGIPEPE